MQVVSEASFEKHYLETGTCLSLKLFSLSVGQTNGAYKERQ